MQSIGQYTLGEEIGRGAMGVVFRGFDPAIGRPVLACDEKQIHTYARQVSCPARARSRFIYPGMPRAPRACKRQESVM
jgi:hypothetical protein